MQYALNDKWDLQNDDGAHYRGTRYHFNDKNEVYWYPTKEEGQAGLTLKVIKGHERVLPKLKQVKPLCGSFRVTELGDVITKTPEKNGEWQPRYVCKLDTSFEFSEIDPRPKDCKPQDLWPSFYDGARYAILGNDVWWKNPDGPRQYIKNELPVSIRQNLNMVKNTGGSFRITENGYVITLIPKQPLQGNVKQQWEGLNAIQQQLIAAKVGRTDMLPIYIGEWRPDIRLRPPKDYTKPLSTDKREEMLSFLDAFSSGPVHEPSLVDVFDDDPEDFYEERGDD